MISSKVIATLMKLTAANTTIKKDKMFKNLEGINMVQHLHLHCGYKIITFAKD